MTSAPRVDGTARAADRSRLFTLGDGPGVVGDCRDLTRRALQDWFGTRALVGNVAVDDILLLVSEVVANAYEHGGAPYELRLDRVGGRLWVQVSDTSPVRPRPHGPHRASRTSGHGLYLLERLSVGWGSVPRGQGKAVWFEAAVTDAAAPAGASWSDAADPRGRCLE
ncbi:ATP-binding protein [Streptomyces sp. NPDC046316]|uniref:ATP-binding protein n=1 Tax=unclassified Streptomyces TaxID=2593676 RepID=UPI0033C703BE